MTHLISTGLQNKKDILFGNMEEIYHFHNRLGLPLGGWRPCLPELCWRRAFPPVKGLSRWAAGSDGTSPG